MAAAKTQPAARALRMLSWLQRAPSKTQASEAQPWPRRLARGRLAEHPNAVQVERETDFLVKPAPALDGPEQDPGPLSQELVSQIHVFNSEKTLGQLEQNDA